MGLADLKKNSTRSNTAAINKQRPMQMSLESLIEDFIDDASMYAAGQSHNDDIMADVIQLPHRVTKQGSDKHSQTNVRQAIQEKAVLKISKGDEPFRKATFTLSESAISHLAEIASGCDIAKSKLIRFLIEHHYSLDEDERKQKEASIIVD
ncbi:CopG family transcriptional regulator [Shewanella sp. UCD-KL12]|uniref:CopG family transcriptional regulator n=1 Tax=Shewanella sp. UCD-KL12 TaxID=1917163 RepID=UPI0009707245|nr:CopG family transcriptional regulator [Shewanella sp. UCD-KL12]